ncbi:hypothetical protein ACXFAU_10810 [Paenibacillus glucanolyticus]
MPTTTGQLRTKIQDMQIGDYIKCTYNAHNVTKTTSGHFYDFAKDTVATELPLIGASAINVVGFFYLIKVDKGLLIADRVVRNTIAWDTLNSSKYIQGRPQERDGTESDFGFDCTVRSLTGGVAYADSKGDFSSSDMDLGGWPTNNEWDKYIANLPVTNIQTGKNLDDVFHWREIQSWCQDTPVTGLTGPYVFHATPLSRVRRGNPKAYNNSDFPITSVSPTLTSQSYNYIGFRPVFEYKEV